MRLQQWNQAIFGNSEGPQQAAEEEEQRDARSEQNWDDHVRDVGDSVDLNPVVGTSREEPTGEVGRIRHVFLFQNTNAIDGHSEVETVVSKKEYSPVRVHSKSNQERMPLSKRSLLTAFFQTRAAKCNTERNDPERETNLHRSLSKALDALLKSSSHDLQRSFSGASGEFQGIGKSRRGLEPDVRMTKSSDLLGHTFKRVLKIPNRDLERSVNSPSKDFETPDLVPEGQQLVESFSLTSSRDLIVEQARSFAQTNAILLAADGSVGNGCIKSEGSAVQKEPGTLEVTHIPSGTTSANEVHHSDMHTKEVRCERDEVARTELNDGKTEAPDPVEERISALISRGSLGEVINPDRSVINSPEARPGVSGETNLAYEPAIQQNKAPATRIDLFKNTESEISLMSMSSTIRRGERITTFPRYHPRPVEVPIDATLYTSHGKALQLEDHVHITDYVVAILKESQSEESDDTIEVLGSAISGGCCGDSTSN